MFFQLVGWLNSTLLCFCCITEMQINQFRQPGELYFLLLESEMRMHSQAQLLRGKWDKKILTPTLAFRGLLGDVTKNRCEKRNIF